MPWLAKPLAAIERVDAGVAARPGPVDYAASVAACVVDESLEAWVEARRAQAPSRGHALPIAA